MVAGLDAEGDVNSVILTWDDPGNANITKWEYWQGTDNGIAIDDMGDDEDGDVGVVVAESAGWNNIPLGNIEEYTDEEGDDKLRYTIRYPDSGQRYHYNLRAFSHDTESEALTTPVVNEAVYGRLIQFQLDTTDAQFPGRSLFGNGGARACGFQMWK